MLITTVQQSDLVILIYMYILFHILFHYGLSQDTKYSSLCYTAGRCCLSILYTTPCICEFQTPSPTLSQSNSLPLGNHQSILLCPWFCFCSIDRFFCVIFYTPHISDTMWYLSFSFWFTSLSMIISSFIHVAANGIIPLFFMAEWSFVVYMYHIFFIHLICQWASRLFPYLGYDE